MACFGNFLFSPSGREVSSPLDPPPAEEQSAIVETKQWPDLLRAAAREGTLGAERVERRLAAILAADVAGYSL
jgi:hypothetical protein